MGDETGENGQRPPWTNVDPSAVIQQLLNQITGMVEILAMKDAYINQLHEALAQVTGMKGAIDADTVHPS